MKNSVTPQPVWLWWIVFAIYAVFVVGGLLQSIIAVSPWVFVYLLAALAPIGILGFTIQRALLWRPLWLGYFFLVGAWGIIVVLQPFVALGPSGFLGLMQLAPIMILMWAFYFFPLLFALWAYVFRSPHIWGDGALAA